MEIASLGRRLAEAANDEKYATRTLISFRHGEHYRRCVSRIFSELAGSTQSPSVKLLPKANAISCLVDDAAKLARDYPMLFIEPDYRLQLDTMFMLPTPGNPSITLDPAQKIPWGVSVIRAPRLWRKMKGERIRIGVVDTGVDFAHPDIRSVVTGGINLINRVSPPIDDNGHGTHIAGTIAASNDYHGIHGVAPLATLFPIKAFDREGSAYVSDIIQAIHWCIDNRMDIINMSFGMAEFSDSLTRAVKAAHRRNVIIVASSGNGGKPNEIDYPARLPQTIAVGAVNKSGRVAAFSNRGSDVDIYAPGESIYSTWPGRRYNVLNGTSMAAAHVSGVAALLLAAKPGLKLSRLKRAIVGSVMPIIGMTKTARIGRLDAVKAWIALSAVKRKKKAKTTVTRK